MLMKGSDHQCIPPRRVYEADVEEALVLAWNKTNRLCAKRLEEPSVHLKEVDAFTIVLEQIATALQQLVPSSLPTHIQPNGLSTSHAQSSIETKETL